MKILLLRSYPRKNGYTAQLTDLFVQGMREATAEIIDRDITKLSINACIGCYRCWVTSPGRCFYKDDMQALQDDLLDADIVVCATPLNSFSVSSSLKAFLDRTLPLTMPCFEQSPLGSVRNTIRFPEKWPKKLAYIVVGAFKGDEIFSGIRAMMTHYANAVSMELCGELARAESFLLPFTLAKPKTVKTIQAAFVKAGYEIATHGTISSETKEKAETPLSADIPYFKKYSNIYWEHAVALGEKSWDLDLLCSKVTTDVRILMQEMARSIDPAATAKLKTTLHFDFSDKETALGFTLRIDHGKCDFYESLTGKPDLVVKSSPQTWAKVFTRQINMRDALVNKEIILSGDKFIFSRLDRYFPPPVV